MERKAFLARQRAIAKANGYPKEVWTAFRMHTSNAAARGIPFRFSITQWWEWWQTDNRWRERGNARGKGNLVMARFNDTGAYAPGNVYCTSVSGNSKGMWQKIKGSEEYEVMRRVSSHLADPQLAWLNRESKKLGITVAELLRRIIDEVRTK